MMVDDYVKVKKGPIEDCLTCRLCFNLFREATTISECVHTFCKECIHQKLEEDGSNCCPLCNVYLGCSPLEKLRNDNNLQDLILKFFPTKMSRDLKNTLTIRKKKRSLSSLIVTPKTRKPGRPCKSGTSGAKVARGAKVAPRMPGMSQKSTRKPRNEKDMTEEKNHLGPSSPLKCSTKSPIVYRKQRISGEEGTSQVAHTIDGPSKNLVTSFSGKDKHVEWERLSVLAETANRKNELHTPLLDRPAINMETNDDSNMRCTRNMKRGALESMSEKRRNTWDLNKSFVPEEIPEPTSNGGLELHGSREQKLGVSAENGSADKSLRPCPLWFTLIACPNKKGDGYPQVPKRYIRIRDGNISVSFVNKYLVEKLNLRHESEVEVMCCGQKLDPSATLNSLVEMWAQCTSKATAAIGVSKSDVDNFVLVLTYRKNDRGV